MWHTMNITEVRRKLRTNLKIGLTEEEVKRRKEKYRFKQTCRNKKRKYNNKIFNAI